ncbi:hypothetical protein MKQ70_36580 [Chitinophaga sedimenti]|uniref:hypothetical protein n=1 Tax=Chitinophaga sedimenti TaxID=2033606 RepID=UPI0020067DC8|nr:hypothetical protein [Chitinophaga sedimenti]MCK7560142.1 hypothetical protein [Chitinophaga sedimenti]
MDPNNFFWSFGPQFKGQTVKDIDGRMIQWNAKPNNVLDAFQVGRFVNTNVSVEGGNENGTFRASYSNLYNTNITNNKSYLKRDNFAIRATQKVTSFINLDASINYSMSSSRNPIAQGGNSSPVFALAYFNPRNYDTKYWKQRENWLDPRGGIIENDPYGLASIWFAQEYNNTVQNEKTLIANWTLLLTSLHG